MTNPSNPIYIVSKGRAKNRLTSKALDAMNVPYSIVVEPQEYDEYVRQIGDESKVLALPFSNLGRGSIPARNWIWEHAISTGAPWHWILDDNIFAFYRFNRNVKHPVATGVTFDIIERFVDRYENVGMAGMQYEHFVLRRTSPAPYYLNTRVYSCILLRNDLPYRWRGKYNEDTDLSLRILKDDWCTLLFNAFPAKKVRTLVMKGGNTDELYQGEGRKVMAESLVEQHPDITTVTWKYGRWQHQVDYSRFKKNRLIRKPGLKIPSGVNDFGMVLQRKDEKTGEWVTLDGNRRDG